MTFCIYQLRKSRSFSKMKPWKELLLCGILWDMLLQDFQGYTLPPSPRLPDSGWVYFEILRAVPLFNPGGCPCPPSSQTFCPLSMRSCVSSLFGTVWTVIWLTHRGWAGRIPLPSIWITNVLACFHEVRLPWMHPGKADAIAFCGRTSGQASPAESLPMPPIPKTDTGGIASVRISVQNRWEDFCD